MKERIRSLLRRFGEEVRDAVLVARERAAAGALSGVAEVTRADTIYRIDKISEEAIGRWFERHWPHDLPMQVTMEGVDDDRPLVFPRGTPLAETRVRLILDPIDGTRNAMYDKRSSWVLAAAAPQCFGATSFRDLDVAVMTEIPVNGSSHGVQVSGLRGAGRQGLLAERISLLDGRRRAFDLRPSAATDCRHGFAGFARFFPDGKALLARIEEELWAGLYGRGGATPLVFEDQYICTGGQIYELLCGHDRFIADLRPLVFRRLGLDLPLVCHPYDICTGWLLEEAGGVLESPDGSPLDVPLDTTSAVAWAGYSNPGLALHIRPTLVAKLREELGWAE